MKKIITLTLFAILLSSSSAMAYVIDGKVDDWGIDINAAVNGGSGIKPSGSYVNGYLDDHLPSGGNDIDYWTEDNADANSGVNTYVGPGYTHTGNTYDAEAIYFDNDATYAYIAILTGVSFNESAYPAGDVFINIGSATDPFNDTVVPNVGSTYAVNVLSGDLYALNGLAGQDALLDVAYSQHSVASPWMVDTSKVRPTDNLGTDLYYRSLANDHYAIEMRIALDDLGLSGMNEDDIWLHWTMKCGNDVLELNADVNNSVPEPATIYLFSSSLLGLFGFKRKRKISAA